MDQGAVRTANNLRAAIGYCLDHPKWRLSVQTHKLLGLR
jgi:organic radical activating enzyme